MIRPAGLPPGPGDHAILVERMGGQADVFEIFQTAPDGDQELQDLGLWTTEDRLLV
jgi:hypothetical protein